MKRDYLKVARIVSLVGVLCAGVLFCGCNLGDLVKEVDREKDIGNGGKS